MSAPEPDIVVRRPKPWRAEDFHEHARDIVASLRVEGFARFMLEVHDGEGEFSVLGWRDG
jgi:hypothetical protein